LPAQSEEVQWGKPMITDCKHVLSKSTVVDFRKKSSSFQIPPIKKALLRLSLLCNSELLWELMIIERNKKGQDHF
jgi:hypothetical protein